MELLLFVLMIQLSSVLSANEEVFDATLYTGAEMKTMLTKTILSKDLKSDRSSVGGIFVHRVEDETYILLASERTGEDAGKVCELGGEGKGGESLLDTLKREVNEESGRYITLEDDYILKNSQLLYRTSEEKAKDGTKLIRHPAFVFIHTYYPHLYDTVALEKAAEAATGDAKEKDKFYWISICSLLRADENILRKEKARIDKDEPESKTMKNEIEVDVLLPNRPESWNKVLIGKKKITLRYWFGVNMLNEHFRNALGSQIMAPPKGPHANQGSWKSVCKLM